MDVLVINTMTEGKTDLSDRLSGKWLRNKDKYGAWAVAITAHVLTGVTIWYFSAVPEYLWQSPATRPIEARLVFPLADTTKPTAPSETTTAITEGVVSSSSAAQAPRSAPTHTSRSVSADENNSVTESAPGSSQAPLSQATPAETNQVEPVVSASGALNEYFAREQQRHISKLGGANARRALEEKNHPRIVDLRKGKSVAISEFPITKKVRCDNTANKILTALSGYAGGTLRCSDTPDISPHIDKRLRESGVNQ